MSNTYRKYWMYIENIKILKISDDIFQPWYSHLIMLMLAGPVGLSGWLHTEMVYP